MSTEKTDKINRVLRLYTKLMNGDVIHKDEEAVRCGVNERSIQRDIEDIRQFMADYQEEPSFYTNDVIYDRELSGYRLNRSFGRQLSNSEILAVCKILLDSRALRKDDMTELLNTLLSCCVPEENRDMVTRLIKNELFHYIEPRHKKHVTDFLWTLGEAIRSCRYIEIEYERSKDKSMVRRKLKPVSILFSEYYFYLTAFIDDAKLSSHFDVPEDPFPTIYRVDRIHKVDALDERFKIPHANRFEEGQYRKRVQFMYGGKLHRVTFKYTGFNIEAILDRLPTAEIIEQDGDVYTITAEVFGTGIDMWLRSQGDAVEVINK